MDKDTCSIRAFSSWADAVAFLSELNKRKPSFINPEYEGVCWALELNSRTGSWHLRCIHFTEYVADARREALSWLSFAFQGVACPKHQSIEIYEVLT